MPPRSNLARADEVRARVATGWAAWYLSAAMAVMETKRIAFTVQYDGGAYHGWQLQPEHRSVQGELESVLTRLFARPARVLGSGRTDRGVHATGQVASVDAPVTWSAAELRRAMNSLLPQEVWVSESSEVAADFHPRYDATERIYVYRVGLEPAAASPFISRWCWPLRRGLDRATMEEETGVIIGDHSFSSFAKAGQEERGDRCTVFAADWRAWGELGLEFRIGANRFLHHMVRYLVGTLVEVGLNRRPAGDICRLLRSEPGVETSPPAPACGLFLAEVRYPPGAYPDNGEASRTYLRT